MSFIKRLIATLLSVARGGALMALPGVPSRVFVEMREIKPNPPCINPTYVMTLGTCTWGVGCGG